MKFIIAVTLVVLAMLAVGIQANGDGIAASPRSFTPQKFAAKPKQSPLKETIEKCVAKTQFQKMQQHLQAILFAWDDNVELLKDANELAQKAKKKVNFTKKMTEWGIAYQKTQDQLLKNQAKLKKYNEIIESHEIVHQQILQNLDLEALEGLKIGKENLLKFTKTWLKVKKTIALKMQILNDQVTQGKIQLANLLLALKKLEIKARTAQVISESTAGELETMMELENDSAPLFEQVEEGIKKWVDAQDQCPKTCLDNPCSGTTPICVPKKPDLISSDLFTCKKIPTNCKELSCAQGFKCKMMQLEQFKKETEQEKDTQNSMLMKMASQDAKSDSDKKKMFKKLLKSQTKKKMAPVCVVDDGQDDDQLEDEDDDDEDLKKPEPKEPKKKLKKALKKKQLKKKLQNENEENNMLAALYGTW